MLKTQKIVLLVAAPLALSLSACSSPSKHGDGHKGGPAYYAVAQIKPTKGNKATGEVRFAEAFGKVKVSGEIRGLQKNVEHGFHIHEFGDATAEDGSSAGGHYNPKSHPHAGPSDEARHAGDLGNLLADKNGVAKFDFTIDGISINTGDSPIVGRGVVVHENKDDLVSQPTGGAGGRIGVGVIGISQK